jgi:hypothetical protein
LRESCGTHPYLLLGAAIRFGCVDVEEALKDTTAPLGVERDEVVGLRPVRSECSVLEHLIPERRPTADVPELAKAD